MMLIGLILGYAIRFIYFIIDLAISFVIGFFKGLYFLIANGENPFKTYWKPFVGFVKFAAVIIGAVVIWSCCLDFKNNKEEYRHQREVKVEALKAKFNINDKGKDDTNLTYTIAETVRK